jgi:heme A synthase
MWTAIAFVPLVGFQGILGAITVKQELPPEVVGTHLVTAMVVFSLELLVAFGMAIQDRAKAGSLNQGNAAARRTIGLWALAAIGWLAMVVWIGGYMAESGATTACSGWPACNGSILPGNDSHEITHMAHRFLAGGLIFLIVPFIVVTWRRRAVVPWAAPIAILAGGLYFAQVAVGAFNVWFTFPDLLTVSHTVIAASVWGSLASAAALAFFAPAAQPTEQRPLGRRVPA